ncbi:polysaccharide deacetylase family protein [Nonomuraea sp. NN258]|uniref:polysaccharide deacetylase family protein n=1 Tax=Nonomuraea antri TaxID=2730852 RepID=UPI0015685C8D|nr:polysaccharide deacetylase family protein [Nonomuraea antri]NRQ34136.1 polysaccharide deacetylase family protein [Nonomuraea antri]
MRLRILASGVITALTLTMAAPAQADTAGPTGEIVQTTRTGGQVVALTFDDGPSPAWTPKVLDLLRGRRIRATFCLLGSQAKAHPDLVRRIVAEGHALCNHSFNHDYLADRTPEEIRSDLTATNDAIRTAAGDPDLPIRYFRAPYGGWGATPQVAASLGMTALAWNMDPADWDGSPSAVLAERLNTQLHPTAVALSHDGGGDRGPTLAAYEQVLPQWQQAGWKFDLPAVTGGPYPPMCTAPDWQAHTVYVEGKRVSRDGRVYQARWWTQLENPASAWWVWTDLGAC